MRGFFQGKHELPTPHKNLHHDPPEFQMALKWWLGLDTSQNGSSCSFCPSHALDPLGHHTLTCKSGGDSIFRHNSLRDTFWESCKLACIAGQIEAGSGLNVEGSRTRPADILLPNWEFGKPAALDFTITSALNPSTLNEASVMAGSAASAAEIRKHVANDENTVVWAGSVSPYQWRRMVVGEKKLIATLFTNMPLPLPLLR